jgi:hypothetical protein
VKLAKKKTLRRWPQADETHFLNVDLDVLSRHPVEPLAKGFGRRFKPHDESRRTG